MFTNLSSFLSSHPILEYVSQVIVIVAIVFVIARILYVILREFFFSDSSDGSNGSCNSDDFLDVEPSDHSSIDFRDHKNPVDNSDNPDSPDSPDSPDPSSQNSQDNPESDDALRKLADEINSKASSKAGSKSSHSSPNSKPHKINRRHLARPNALVPLFVVYNIADEHRSHPVSFTTSKEQAAQVVDRFVFYMNFADFKHWAPIHDFPVDSHASWIAYCDAVLDEPANPRTKHEDFYVVQYLYSIDEIASIFRMFSSCAPLALDFELDEEFQYYQASKSGSNMSPLDYAVQDVKNFYGS